MRRSSSATSSSAWTKVMNADRFDLPQNPDSVEPIGIAEPAVGG